MLNRFLALPLTLLLFSCSSDKNDDNNNNKDGGTPAVTMSRIDVSLDIAEVSVGKRVVATAKGKYSDNTEKDLTGEVTWRASPPENADMVSGQPGEFDTKKEGTTFIIADLGAESGRAVLTITAAALESLEIIPPAGDIGMGGTLRVAVVATKSDGAREAVTERVSWDSSNDMVLRASAQDTGYLVPFAKGSADITATMNGVSVTGTYNVTDPLIESIIISPQNTRIDAGNPVQFSATGFWTNNNTTDVTGDVTWNSSDPAIVTIDTNGLATAIGDGDVVITAEAHNITAQTIARTVSSSNCDYPDNPPNSISYDAMMPPIFWLDAYDQDGNLLDFRLQDTYCDAVAHPVLIFAITAGWCPYCPDYLRAVDDLTPDLVAEGAIVIYVEIETSGGAPANNLQAHTLIGDIITNQGPNIRVGDGDAAGGISRPFSTLVSSVPNAVVVRTSDMKVIAIQERSSSRLDFLQIARDPNRLY